MKTQLTINEPQKVSDYFPCLFTNANQTIVILADGRTGDRTFSGMIISSNNNDKKTLVGTYSTGWTYQQFSRLPKGSNVIIGITQGED